MKLIILIDCLVLLLFISGCKKNENGKITEPPEGCIILSELLTKQDYYLPFALENDNKNVLTAVLNNETIDFSYGSYIEFKDNGFHELVLIYRDPQQENDTILFTTMTEEREASEWGIGAWVPALYETKMLGQENVEIYYPRRFTDLINVPLIFYEFPPAWPEHPGQKQGMELIPDYYSFSINNSALYSFCSILLFRTG